MGFEDIVTKEDLKCFETRILNILEKSADMVRVPEICHSDKAREIIGGASGPVSLNYLKELRRKKLINPKKLSGKWIFNVKELVQILPPDPITNIKK